MIHGTPVTPPEPILTIMAAQISLADYKEMLSREHGWTLVSRCPRPNMPGWFILDSAQYSP